MPSEKPSRIDWDAVADYRVRAHALRSAEVRRLFGLLLAGFAWLVRRPIKRRRPVRLHPAGC